MISFYGRVRSCTQRTVSCYEPSVDHFIGEQCLVESSSNWARGEVLRIQNGLITVELLETTHVKSGAKVKFTKKKFVFPLDKEKHIGSAIDCYGNVLIDNGKVAKTSNNIELLDINIDGISLEKRKGISDIFETRIKAIDALFTIGIGQRLGLFAPAGAGKTTTLSMMANNMNADYVVFAMIGERAREVTEFMEGEIGESVLAKSILVISTSDASPLEKVRSAYVAVNIAQKLMSEGKRVLLLFDSLTRFPRALAMLDGTPINKTIPINVSLGLSKLVECCGNTVNGSITAIFTVLIEGDVDGDPIAHEVKSLIDGHIILSSEVAATGRYPAIEILKSKSRLQDKLCSGWHIQQSNKVKRLLQKFYDVQLLLRVGEYVTGNDIETDEAIEKVDFMESFLSQNLEGVDFEETQQILKTI